MPPTSPFAQYVMWGMLIILIGIMIALYFHFKDMPIRDVRDEDDPEAEADASPCSHCTHCGDETLEDHAKRIAKRCKDDPNHTPHN